jgi:hypothetical protein
MQSSPSGVSQAAYVKHAERFGTEVVYQSAEEHELPALDLGYLARHLRRIGKSWKLDPSQRERLIRGLIAADVPDREIRDIAKVSQDTVRRFREESRTSISEPTHGLTMRREVRKPTWDREYPYQTIYDHFSRAERLTWPRVGSSVEVSS